MATAVVSSPHSRADELYGLLAECPHLRGNPVHCVLFDLRKRTMMARSDWARNLPDDSVEQVFQCCEDCLRWP